MKRILCIFVIILALLQITSCHLIAANVYTRYDVNEDGLEIRVDVMHKHGDKNDITLERYYHPDGWIEKEISYNDYRTDDIMYITIFNENGGKKSVESFYKETNWRTYESYDDNGVLISTHNYENGSLQFIEEFYASGNRKKVTDYTDPAFEVRITTFADAKDGRILTDYSKWYTDKEITEETDYYDSASVRVKVEMNIKTLDGKFIRHYVDEYDQAGNLIKTTNYSESGDILDISDHK